jgi:hypothetical protein
MAHTDASHRRRLASTRRVVVLSLGFKFRTNPGAKIRINVFFFAPQQKKRKEAVFVLVIISVQASTKAGAFFQQQKQGRLARDDGRMWCNVTPQTLLRY